jgi:hypothetical protein
MSDNAYIPLKPHPVPDLVKPYLDQMTPKERELHELAVSILGSSYFVEYSHGYLNWFASVVKKAKNT